MFRVGSVGSNEHSPYASPLVHFPEAKEENISRAQDLSAKRLDAEQGCVHAQFCLGKVLEEGGDIEEAKIWYLRAAEQGSADAYFKLGYIYENESDYHQAMMHYTIAAQHGHQEAQYSLGFMYERGVYQGKDIFKARMWYKHAAQNGHSDAKMKLETLSS